MTDKLQIHLNHNLDIDNPYDMSRHYSRMKHMLDIKSENYGIFFLEFGKHPGIVYRDSSAENIYYFKQFNRLNLGRVELEDKEKFCKYCEEHQIIFLDPADYLVGDCCDSSESSSETVSESESVSKESNVIDGIDYDIYNSLLVMFPIEGGTDIMWDDKTYELFCKEGIEEWKSEFEKKPDSIYDRKSGNIILNIDMKTGLVRNFPENSECSFRTVKIRDCGSYMITDKNGNLVMDYEGYVPDILEIEENGWGDYMEFYIKDSKIQNWKVTQELLDDFKGNCR